MEDEAAMRGMEANRLVVYRRAMDLWHAYTLDRAREAALATAFNVVVAGRALGEWRRMLAVGGGAC